MEKREKFASRLGFILVSAGCEVGIGNVWKFPYICGMYGGAAFIIMYLVFLVLLGKLKLAVFPFPALHCGLHAFYDVTVDAAVLWVG